jgi:hypothetical protein
MTHRIYTEADIAKVRDFIDTTKSRLSMGYGVEAQQQKLKAAEALAILNNAQGVRGNAIQRKIYRKPCGITWQGETMTLPKLPEPNFGKGRYLDLARYNDAYTADQILQFQRDTVEACAKVCIEHQYELVSGHSYADKIMELLK